MIAKLSTPHPASPPPHTDPLLATKLAPPRTRPTLLARPRLIAQLDLSTHIPLTLITAPAGYGKTTLLCDWACRQAGQIAWVTLDEGDSDPTRFWRYAIHALQTVAPGIGADALVPLQLPLSNSLVAALTALVNDIADCLHNIVLVFDDYHLIDSAAIHDSLIFLLDHLPPQLHLVIATRHDPPLPLARLRARGHLSELRGDNLRLTPDETAALLLDVLRLPLEREHVTMLAAHTEGWIAGLHLAALMLRDHTDPAGFIQTFSGNHRAIADYLLDEALVRQPAHIQTFLLETALLDRLSASLCEAVTGRADSQALLEGIERANLFLVPLDAERGWYRYHALFAEALRDRLVREQRHTPRIIHRRAAGWLVTQGQRAEAIPHALAAGDLEQAAELIASMAEPLLLRGEVTTLLNWLEMLPDALLMARPALLMARAFARMAAGQIAALDMDVQTLATAEPHAGDSPDTAGTPIPLWMRESAPALQVLTAMLRDAEPQLQDQLYQVLGTHSSERITHYLVNLNQGFAHWAHGAVAPARAALRRAAQVYQRTGDRHGEALVTALLAEISQQEGRLYQAAQLYEQATQLLDRPRDRDASTAGVPLIGLGMVCYEWNELDRAERLLDQGLDLAFQGGRADVVLTGLIARARIQQSAGDGNAARATMAQAVRHARATRTPRLIAYTTAQQAALWLAQGDDAAAMRWANAQDMGVDDSITYLRELEYLTFARVLLAQGAYDDALHLLLRLRSHATDAGRFGQAIPILAVAALAHQARGDLEQAQEAIAQALILGAPGGYVRGFVDLGTPLIGVLERAREQIQRQAHPTPSVTVRAYLDRMLSACQKHSPTPSPLHLSPREIDLLRCIAAGMSNKAIALQLRLATTTVKWYVAKLYEKLDVGSRTQALARARELGLVQ